MCTRKSEMYPPYTREITKEKEGKTFKFVYKPSTDITNQENDYQSEWMLGKLKEVLEEEVES